MQTTWNLGLLYTSAKDPEIEKDIRAMKRAYDAFAKKYASRKDFIKNETKLLAALTDYEQFIETVSAGKPFYYYHYRRDQNSEDHEALERLTKLQTEFIPYENKIEFFTLLIGKIPKKDQRKFLQSKKLARYHRLLEGIFETSKYQLTEAEEKILNLTSMPSYSMWVDGMEKMRTKQMISFGKKEIPMAEAMNLVRTLPREERLSLHTKIMERSREMSDFAESEMNAIVTNKKIRDELRGYKKPYSATIQSYENEEKSIENLVATVTKNYKIAHRLYTLQAKLLQLPTLSYADRAVPVGEVTEKIPFSEASKRFGAILTTIDVEFANIFERFLEEGHIDVLPRRGKAGGAYCSHGPKTPTYVLLNHVDDFNSFMTLAHEMGHAFHAELSRTQPTLYQGYGMGIAETASTLFERLVFDTIVPTLSPEERFAAMHERAMGDVSSVFRQIAFFNFEHELHTTIREKGSMTGEQMARLLNRHMSAYLGPAVKMEEIDGYFFVDVSHFRRFFYVYSYAYGLLISKALAKRVRENPAYIKEIKQFLSAGGSKKPEAIFKSIGVDTKNPKIFEEGLRSIEADIKELELLAKKLGKV